MENNLFDIYVFENIYRRIQYLSSEKLGVKY